MRHLSSRRSSRLALLAIGGLTLTLGGCGDGDGGFARGRACRIGERMVAAVAAGDEATAADEARRLDALDGSGEQFDLDEIIDAAEGQSDDPVDDLRELFDAGGCDIDNLRTEDGSTPPTPLPTMAPTSGTPVTEPDTTPPPGSSPPVFTLPVPSGPPTSAPATSTPPSSPPATTDEPPPTTTVAPPPTSPPNTPSEEIVEVDVGAIESENMPPGVSRTPIETARRYGGAGMIVPATPAMVTDTYVSRGLTYGAAYDSITSVADTEVPLAQIASRFQAAISRTGTYRFGPLASATDDSVGFNAAPVGSGPGWEVNVAPSPTADLVEIRVVRSDFGESASRQIPDAIRRMLADQLAVIDDLDWTADTASELRSDASGGFSTASVNLTVRAIEPRDAADLVAARIDGAAVEPGAGSVTVTTAAGDWVFTDASQTDVFVSFSTNS